MSYFIDVILPVPLNRLYTYSVYEDEYAFLEAGMRVVVPFGKSKTYTGIVYKKHLTPPMGYDAKPIIQIIDNKPVVLSSQLTFWDWIASYYCCSLGAVYLAALPSLYRLESTQFVQWIGPDSFDPKDLSDASYLIYEALQKASSLEVDVLIKLLGTPKIFGFLHELMELKLIAISERVYEKYKDKLVAHIRINEDYEKQQSLMEEVLKTEKQRRLVMTYYACRAKQGDAFVDLKFLLDQAQVSRAVLKNLLDKNIFIREDVKVDRVQFNTNSIELGELSKGQNIAFDAIKQVFSSKSVCLFKGVTGSGKTHIYAHLIQEYLNQGKQVLYLLPEIGLTTQILSRLEAYFGEYLLVYHSKYNAQERTEVYQKLIDEPDAPRVVVGVRSSLFLPFSNLGMIVVDEEHESSYKQQDPAPRFQARDSAIVFGHQMQVKVLLGSATPSIESSYNVSQGKYGQVDLRERYNPVQQPEINLVDLKDKYRKKRMKGHFSDTLIQAMTDTLEEGRQVILFQNRRGFAPVVECQQCGHSPQCPNCDVSLTFHKYSNELRCHYCFYKAPVPKSCSACGSHELDTKGFGTEQIAKEAKDLFPEIPVGRMDMDSTRGKNAYSQIIQDFQQGKTKILVGTQMLSKGLDFEGVGLVGVMQADSMLNFPDFRAHERAFQLLAQVAGRSGRVTKRGQVLIQTFNPYHQILQQVSRYDFDQMYKEQLEDRYQFKYPPFIKLIRVTLKHKDRSRVALGAKWFSESLENTFGNMVLGPSIPSIERVRNQYIRHILLKIPKTKSLSAAKNHLKRIENQFDTVAEFRAIRLNIDVDPN